MVCYHRFRGGMQIARTSIVPKARPKMQHIVQRRRR